ncbi:fimbrial protein [Cronobacter sakazakii]|nr:fimbrial protein [Cronobacter sakazakii]ELY2757705.1 fimbrial protein [Cronobacter sakazakii]ELY4067992.1 fimbrial protein [Cronobacter sakazakii]ELY4095400.1 fimbrial protein [Cronobacter sakazakii]ELY4404198.1 fimbrial protein [Cronobacter sakazakii]
MKSNKIIGLMITGLLFAGAAQASVSSEDAPASLFVTGKLSSVNQGCRVSLSQESVSFTVDTSQLVSQGDNATAPQAISVFINGADKDGACADAVSNGHIAVKFMGQADNAEGTTLANQYASSGNAASGVGIGFFAEDDTPLAINNDLLKVSKITLSHLGKVSFGVQPVKLANQNVTAGGVSGAVTVQIERL